MTRYSEELKQSVIAKMMPPENKTIGEIARETEKQHYVNGARKRVLEVSPQQQMDKIQSVGAHKINSLSLLQQPV